MKDKINSAFEHMTPDILDSILSDCKEQKGTVIFMKEKRFSSPYFKRFAGLAAAFALAITGVFGFNIYNTTYAVSSVVSLDVNPSLEIKVNKQEKVLSVTPLNDHAKTIIGEMDFEGSSLDITVNALIGSMLKNGYITEIANSILVSVDNDNKEAGEALQKKLTDEINELLKTDKFSGAVLSQTIDENSDTQKLAADYGITPGKAQLIQKIIEKDSLHTFEELAPLSINELNVISKSKDVKFDNVKSVGSASDRAYIGEEKAKEIAHAHAGVASGDIVKSKIEIDYENGIMVYEYEFDSSIYEFEYDINATNGEIVKSDKEYSDSYQKQLKAEQKAASQAAKAEQKSQNESVKIEKAEKAQTKEETKTENVQNNNTNTNKSNNAAINNNANENSNADIGRNKAKEIALSSAGVSESEARKIEVEADKERGIKVYEVEFNVGNVEYKYDIDANSGAVVDFEKDIDD